MALARPAYEGGSPAIMRPKVLNTGPGGVTGHAGLCPAEAYSSDGKEVIAIESVAHRGLRITAMYGSGNSSQYDPAVVKSGGAFGSMGMRYTDCVSSIKYVVDEMSRFEIHAPAHGTANSYPRTARCYPAAALGRAAASCR